MSQKRKSLCLDYIPICLMYSPEQREKESKSPAVECAREVKQSHVLRLDTEGSPMSLTQSGVNAKSRRLDYQAVQTWRQITTEEAWFGT